MTYLPQIRLALVGTKGSGKTTFAKTLQDYYGFSVLSFSAPIKVSLVRAVNAFLADQGVSKVVTLNDIVNNKESYRLGMQWLGTEIMRESVGRRSHWVDKLISSVDSISEWNRMQDQLSAIVVDDVRFQNEADALRNRGFRIVRVVSQGTTDYDPHTSEVELRTIPTDETLHLGATRESTEELARQYGYTLVTELLSKLAKEGSTMAEGWVDFIRVHAPFEVQQELRQIGGVSGIKTSGWSESTRLRSF